MFVRLAGPPLAVCLALLVAAPALGGDVPTWLPRYDLDVDLDLAAHHADCHLRATWTNTQEQPTDHLVFNAHSVYVVPDGEVGLMAKTLEILRVNAGEVLGEHEPAFNLRRVLLEPGHDQEPIELPFHYEGDTKTSLVVPLPFDVRHGQSVTVRLDFVFRLPQKQGRWGQWRSVTFLSNWLPVLAVYGPQSAPAGSDLAPVIGPCWQPTPFIPWHLPFFNEAGDYHVRVRLPCDQRIACTGTIVARTPLPDGREEVHIEAPGFRDFAFLCSARYVEFVGKTPPGPGVPDVNVHVLCLPGHEFYAKEMVRIAADAIARYSQWIGPYPWPDFTIAESFFGWNGNQCGGLVMIDERIFGMPHLGENFVEYLVTHETCHQWFYNLIGTNGYCETWMMEAIAVHLSHRIMNERYGKNNKLMQYPTGLEWLPNIRREDYRSYSMLGTIGRGENSPVVQPMDKFGHVVNLFSMCYDKGSRIQGLIEERLGPAGFEDFLRRLYCRYQWRVLRVADYQRELEEFTGRSWDQFFRQWIYGSGLSDWAVAGVEVQPAPCVARKRCQLLPSIRTRCAAEAAGLTRVIVTLKQKADIDEETTLGFALPDQEGYPVRVPILPGAGTYSLSEPNALVEQVGPHCWRVEVLLPDEPTQVTVDPDQVLVDRDPSNNFWKQPFRWRITPLYTFLEETDLTNAYDRWNLIFGPWVYGTTYDDPWYTRSTMFGVRAGAYRTQQFSGGAYAAYRTDFRDVVAGVDALWDHWPDSHFQVGFNAERRLYSFYSDSNNEAVRAVVYGRYIFQYGSSLYLPPMHFVELYADYQDDFFPIDRLGPVFGERPERQTTTGLHYHLDYLTPYWDAEGGFKVDLWAEGGEADLLARQQVSSGPTRSQGIAKVSGQFSTVKELPDLSELTEGVPVLGATAGPALRWLGETRLAVRMYGATAVPTRGEFYTMGGSELFRGFDLAQRQGSTVWVGSLEWRVPIAKGLTWDACDHIVGLRNLYGAAFYDVGDAYTLGHEVGPVAHAVGGGIRADVAWFGFVERTMLRFDVAKTVNADSPAEFWLSIQHPF